MLMTTTIIMITIITIIIVVIINIICNNNIDADDYTRRTNLRLAGPVPVVGIFWSDDRLTDWPANTADQQQITSIIEQAKNLPVPLFLLVCTDGHQNGWSRFADYSLPTHKLNTYQQQKQQQQRNQQAGRRLAGSDYSYC